MFHLRAQPQTLLTFHTGRGRLSGELKLLIHTSFQDRDNLPLLLAIFFLPAFLKSFCHYYYNDYNNSYYYYAVNLSLRLGFPLC